MSLFRHRARNDGNHTTITQTLREAHVPYREIKYPSDLLAVSRAGAPVFVEIKRDSKAKLTLIQSWLAETFPKHFVRAETPEQTLRALGYVP
jgi:hypothetical protein